MPATNPCLGVEELKEFLLGLLPESRARLVEEHLTGCPSCLARLPELVLDDPLVSGLRQQRSRPRLSNPLLSQTLNELRSRPFRAPADAHTPAGQVTEATVGEAPAPATSARSPASPAGPLSFLSAAQGPDELGRLGGFRVLRVLGEGGMGVVLLAEDDRLQRRVALKVMRPALAADPVSRSRFLREARATAALSHDHVVAIHHIDEANGLPFLAMPLLTGETLDERLRREGLLTLPEVLRIGREIAEGLAAAHEKGLIHRDVKPSNVWLEAPSGRVKILDFGLASMPSAEGEKTLPGTLLGTPGYMAPEQAEGHADAKSDLFSLGCVLYRMATGRLPFRGDSAVQKIRSTLFDEPEAPQNVNPALPAPLCHLILKLLSKKPEDRPTTALAVARVLQTLETQFSRTGSRAPLAIPLSPDATPPVKPAPLAVPVPPAPSPAPPTPVPVGSTGPGRRWLLLSAGALLAGLAVLLVVAARSPQVKQRLGLGPAPDRADGGLGPYRRDRIQRPGGWTAPVAVVTPDNTFPETWVTRPEPLPGLAGWSIETNDIGQAYPTGFLVLDDKRLLIHYSTPNLGPARLWQEFDAKTCGLTPAPFDGSFDALSRDGRACARVVSGGVQLWELGGETQWITLRSPGAGYTAAFSPDGKTVVTPNTHQNLPACNNLWFWDARRGPKLGVCSSEQQLNAAALGWSPDSKTLAVAGWYNGVALVCAPWNAITKQLPRPRRVAALAWSPKGNLLATVEEDRRLHVIDVAAEEELEGLPDLKVALGPVLAWSPDGRELAVATEDKKVVVYDLEDRKVTFAFTGHRRAINSVAFLPDGRTLVSASAGGVRFWDLKTDSFRGTLLNLANQGWLAISPDGNYRGSANAESRFVIKVLEEGKRFREFSPDNFRKLTGWKNDPDKVKLVGD